MNIQEPTPNKPYIHTCMRGDDLIFCKVKCKLPIYSVLVIMRWASSFKNAPLGGKKHFLLISTFNYLSQSCEGIQHPKTILRMHISNHFCSFRIEMVFGCYTFMSYSQSAAYGSYLRGLPAGASLRSATPPRRSLRSPYPVYMTVEDP